MREIEAQATMQAAGEAIVVRVDRAMPAWFEGRVAFIADAWGRLDPMTRDALDARAHDAARAATARVTAALEEFFALAAAEQRTTPLEIVRSAVRDITDVLAASAIPPIERDPFDERAFPDDHYGVTPVTLADLGDDELGGLQLAWGYAKSEVLRARPSS